WQLLLKASANRSCPSSPTQKTEPETCTSMARSGSPSVKTITLDSSVARLILIVPLLCAAIWGWFAARWYLADVISEVVTTGDAPNIDLARMATRWGPDDPFVHWRLGTLTQNDFSATNAEQTVREFQFAVR